MVATIPVIGSTKVSVLSAREKVSMQKQGVRDLKAMQTRDGEIQLTCAPVTADVQDFVETILDGGHGLLQEAPP